MAFRTAFVLASLATIAADTHAKTATTQSKNTESQSAKESKAEHNLQLREDRIQTGREAVEHEIGQMASHRASLSALAKNHQQLDQLADQISSRVVPSLSAEQRKALESHYTIQLNAISNTNADQPGADKKVADSETAAEQDIDKLRDADHKDARSLRQAFSQSRHDAHGKVRSMARASTKALHEMGSSSGLESAMEKDGKSEKTYDRAEDALGDQKDRYMDQIGSLHDGMDDLVEDIYSKVHDRLASKADSLEEDAHSRREQRRKTVREAAEKLKMSGSLSRVEQKLHRLETAMQQSTSSQQELISSTALVRTNTVCTALFCAGLVVSLAMHAMQRRESRFSGININQADLFA